MRTIFAVLALCAPLSAAETSKVPPEMQKLIEAVVAKGKEKKLIDSLAMNLGFSGPVVAKAVALHGADKASHGLYVVYAVKDGKKTPTALVFAVARQVVQTAVKAEGGAIVPAPGAKPEMQIDAFDARADLSGKLLGAVRSRGPKAAVKETVVPIADATVAADFAAEKKFFLDALPLLQK